MVKEKKQDVQKESYFEQVKKELKKVKWPSKKELIKYSVTTLCFILFFALFFFGIETLFAFIEGR